jgi:hypothetical protein
MSARMLATVAGARISLPDAPPEPGTKSGLPPAA